MTSIQLVLFDMDGVIFEGDNFWLELHQKYGTDKKGIEFASKYLHSDYGYLAELVAKGLWKGNSASIYKIMIEERRYQPGIRRVFEFLHQSNIRSVIISSGPYELALRAQKELSVDRILANRLLIEDNVISGEVEVMVPDGEKERIGLEILSELQVPPFQTAFVGDSEADVGLAKVIGLPIAYNSQSDNLNQVCTYVLKYGELEKFVDILRVERELINRV